MTVTILPRQLGARLSCNYPGCDERLVTGQTVKDGLRVHAATQGWIRGLDPGSKREDGGGRLPNRRWDICPVHAVEERARRDARKAAGDEMRARRAEIRALPLEEQAAVRVAARLASRRKAKAKWQAKRKALAALIPAVSS